MNRKDLIKEFNEKVEKFGLGSYEVVKDFDGSAESSEYYAWWYFPELIDFHRKIRDKVSIFHIINISILVHSAIVVEGFLYELIKLHIGEMIGSDDLESRLHNEFNEKLDKSSWSDLKHYYKLAIDSELNLVTDNENWKSISTLFLFRNMLTHSKPVKFSVRVKDDMPTIKHFGNYESIYNFLLEKKLIQKVDIIKSMSTELINSNIADFFWNESQIFIKNVLNSDEDFNKLPIADSYEIAFEYKNID
jgi:hypothetical protein